MVLSPSIFIGNCDNFTISRSEVFDISKLSNSFLVRIVRATSKSGTPTIRARCGLTLGVAIKVITITATRRVGFFTKIKKWATHWQWPCPEFLVFQLRRFRTSIFHSSSTVLLLVLCPCSSTFTLSRFRVNFTKSLWFKIAFRLPCPSWRDRLPRVTVSSSIVCNKISF